MSDPDRSDDELADDAAELAVALRQLRDELERQRTRRRRKLLGMGAIPKPPSVRDVLRFADEFAIPTVIAVLEANIKILESLQGAIRMAETGHRAGERSREVGETAAGRAGDVSKAALARLEDGLEDLRTALEGGAVPEDAASNELLAEIRELQADVEERIEASREERERVERGERGGSIGETDRTADDESENEDEVPVDVDAELESLRERYQDGDEDDEDDEE